MKRIETSVEVDAPPDVVWSVVADFPSYPEWNPFITAIDGEFEMGARLRATMALPGRKPRVFTPTVIVLDPGRRLTWLGRLFVPGLFDGEHTLQVEGLGDGPATFVQSETFRGVLPPLLGGLLTETHAAFETMNAALAARAETVASAGGSP